MDKDKLNEILEQHRKWVTDEDEGERADLRGADLRRADLWGADLRRADLRGADLNETIYENINWLAFIGIIPDRNGKARAYKLIDKEGEGIFQGGLNYLSSDKYSVPKVDKDVNIQCSYGINLATFSWCIFERREETDRLIMMEFNIKDSICPINSDGKFRVKECKKVGECDWQGNLLEAKNEG